MVAAWTLCTRELVHFSRARARLVGAVAPPVLFWLLIGSGFEGSFRASTGGRGYLAYFFPGAVLLTVLFASIFSSISLIEDRREGFLQGVLVAPLPPYQVVLGKVLGGTLLATAEGTLILILAPLAGIPPGLRSAVGSVAVVALIAFGLTAMGFAFAWRIPSYQGFHSVMNLFLMPMWLLSGALFPGHGAPAALRAVMALNPLTYGLAALRHALYMDASRSPAGIPSPAVALTVAAGFAALMMALAVALAGQRSE